MFTSSEDTSLSSGDEVNSKQLSRTRRDLPHGVSAHALKTTKVQSNTSKRLTTSQLTGNPTYGNIMRLYCRTGKHLTISVDGKVDGTEEESDNLAIMEIQSAGIAGYVFIKGMESKLYLAMDEEGRLYGEKNNDVEQTVWLERFQGAYNTYLSRKFVQLGWFLAIKKSGKPKRGNRTAWGQKAIQFLPRRLESHT